LEFCLGKLRTRTSRRSTDVLNKRFRKDLVKD